MRLFLFLLIFTSLYGSLHLYGFLKVKRALLFGTPFQAALIVFMVIMVFTPVIVRICERAGLEYVAGLLAYAGYLWMGLLFVFVCSGLVIDAYTLLTTICRWLFKVDLSGIIISPKHAFFIPLILGVLINLYGWFEARQVRTEHITIQSSKIPKAVGKIRIAQISDVHLGLIVREGRLKRILEQVRAADPDIFVSTGDLVDGQMDNLTGLAELLRGIHTKYGKFSVTGNHEFYAGIDRTLDFTKKAGFTILRGEGLHLGGINIVGVDDPTVRRFQPGGRVSENSLLSRFSRERFTLLLKHQPVVDEKALGLFDLQLSGHTHKGQIFPFIIFTKIFYSNSHGLYRLDKGAHLYVSRGSGTWGPPIRFLAPPEVTVIELVHG